MKTLMLYIEKNHLKKFIGCLNRKLKETPFCIDQSFCKKDQKCSTFLHHTLFSYSCFYGRLEFCKYLLSKGADPIGKRSAIGEGFPLTISILYNQFHIADWLQKTLNIDCSINDSWPLTMSVHYGNLSGVKYALKHNADIHALNDYALRDSATYGCVDLVKYLMSKGADIHVFNSDALRAAVQNNHFKTAEYLLDHGADPNAKNKNGCILQWLIEKDQLRLAAKAVSYGADPTVLSPSQQQKLNTYIFSRKMTRAKKF